MDTSSPAPEEEDQQRPKYRRRLERERYYTQAVELPSATSNTTSNMASTTSGGKLAQEIHDEFLTCKICLEGFKSPKCLDCLHTFCEQCIDNHVMSECTYKKYSDYREFTCPLCRKRTQLPIGGVKKLPDNFLVSNLGETISRQRPSKFPFCDICKLVNRKHREATSKCLDCNKLLCKQCVDLHKETKVTKSHSLFDVEIEKDIECKEHKDEVVRFYCEPCEACICVLCTFNEHKDHDISQFSDAVLKYKESIQCLLNSCKDRIDVYDTQLTLLSKCESVIKAAEQKIRDVAIQFISEIRNKEKVLIDDLHTLYGKELMEYVSRRSEMQANLDGLKSTCNLTELVLKGKDIELLLLKKQVQDKLSCLSDIEIKDLPKTVNKVVNFNPGTLDIGVLEDTENANQKTTPGKNHTGKTELHIKTTETQTDAPVKAQMCNRCLQTDIVQDPEPSPTTDKYIATDSIDTSEKAVNTRSRISSHVREDTPPEVASPEPTSSPVPRRHRRRRERPRPVEVSVRPTTNSPEFMTTLSYSSSIDDSFYDASSNSNNVTSSPV
ncbi:tripartite motif-containing protein 2-like isoform X1 [Haliotis asinina]|uniref:tripartite motif-containing protein 2-like isoform X1 n=1 Tax=Haliotis asinina TaxID=109174 RepID=UPI00353264EA